MKPCLDLLDKNINQKHMLNHTFYMKWSKGELTKEQLKAYAKDYYLHIKAFPRYLSAIHSRCDNVEARKVLLDNLMDEEIGNPNHIDLWKNFAYALGVTKEELENHVPSAAAQKKVATFLRWCSGDSLSAGISALYTYESQIPAVAETKISGLKQYFGFTNPEDYEYFSVHQDVDVRHARQEKELIETLLNNDCNKILQASREVCDALYDFLDSFLDEKDSCSTTSMTSDSQHSSCRCNCGH
ncbi:CADD family putative folate metabolism protein [Chlamydia abortus]|uniref:CADD family putative folate metabolism protein n=1 Tax=Chlamydia abortus TaxID=83555 RepID=UPI0011F032D7|nr:CADD family putative folate metabolism protein [Chlamydia abortus]QEM74285.1 CADD family putative folate metabolism protein [Chlamydia abortus]CAD7583755.1 Alternative para-aminobenzoate biosynthesis enzyme CT610 [Chlamydia abortus]CAG9046189.1 putative oxidoreductase CT_610 [Chlamydia abortus]